MQHAKGNTEKNPYIEEKNLIPNIIITSLIILKLENWLAIPEGKQKKGVIILDKKVDSENVTQDDSFFRHAAQK